VTRRVLTTAAATIAVLAAAGPALSRDSAAALIAVATACALATFAAAQTQRAAVALALGLSPALTALVRSDPRAALGALIIAGASGLLFGRRGWQRGLGLTLAAVGVAIACAAPTLAAGELSIGAAAGAWGILAGPAIPPWRLDLALPMWTLALPLIYLGAGHTALARASALLGLLGAGALVGATQCTIGSSATAAGCLAPLALTLAARGVERLPARVPRWPLALATVAISSIGVANVHLAVDVLDPALRVPWGEAGRMLSVLAEGDTAVVAFPTMPARLEIRTHAPTDPAEAGRHARIVVVSHGVAGGLRRASAPFEALLAGGEHRLRGEIEMGELEPGMRRWLERFGYESPAPAYLRIRRWERRPAAAATGQD